jgi:excisionase family DNA binding protein
MLQRCLRANATKLQFVSVISVVAFIAINAYRGARDKRIRNMASLAVNFEELHEPSTEDIAAASTAARALSRFAQKGPSVSLVPQAVDGESANIEPITLPMSIFRIIVNLLVEMGNGNAVAIVPVNAELTTQQAADLLNVSRPHLVKLLDKNELSCRMVGTHRKLQAKEVLNYRSKTTHARSESLKKMVALDEELGLYDDEPVSSKD